MNKSLIGRREFLIAAGIGMNTLLVKGAAQQTESPKSSCDFHIDKEPGPNPWTHLNFHNDPNNFQFAIVGDISGRQRQEVFPEVVRKLNLLQPQFVMSVGDLIDGDTTNSDELKAQWQDFINNLKPLEIPFFPVP